MSIATVAPAKEKRWHVVSPVYEYTEPVLDYGQGPRFETCDVVAVMAENRRQAIVCGVRKMRHLYPNGYHATCNDVNPFKGVRVEPCDCDGDCEAATDGEAQS